MSLTAARHAVRQQALDEVLAATDKGLQKELARLKKQQEDLEAKAEQTKATALARVKETQDRLAAERTLAFHAAAQPLIEKFTEEPTRAISRALSALWATTAEDFKETVGHEFDSYQLAVCFMRRCIREIPAAVVKFANDSHQEVMSTAHGLTKTRVLVDWEQLLPQLEGAVIRFGQQATANYTQEDFDRSRVRFELLLGAGSQLLRSERLAENDREQEAEASRHAVAAAAERQLAQRSNEKDLSPSTQFFVR